MIWNPLSHLQETTKYPWARFIRSSFKTRIIDTFRVFYGDFFSNRMGLLDYIYPLSRFLTAILVKLNQKDPRYQHLIPTPTRMILDTSLILLFSIPTFLLTVPKLIAAVTLTLLASPITALVHFYQKSKKDNLVEKVKNLKINLYRSNINKLISNLDESKDLEEENTLINILPEKEFDLLSIRPIAKFSEDSPTTFGEYPKTDYVQRLILLGLFSIKRNSNIEPHIQMGIPLAMIKITPQNITPIKAILTSNMFWTNTHLETADAFTALEAEMNRAEVQRVI